MNGVVTYLVFAACVDLAVGIATMSAARVQERVGNWLLGALLIGLGSFFAAIAVSRVLS